MSPRCESPPPGVDDKPLDYTTPTLQTFNVKSSGAMRSLWCEMPEVDININLFCAWVI
jgi:hypothetical protein